MKNRKSKLNKIFKIGILCIGISLLIFNCEKNQESVVESEILNDQLITTNTNFKALQNDPLFSNFVNELQLEKLTNLNPNINKKTQNGELTLNPNFVKKVVQGDKISYNILAKREGQDDNIIENVVLQNINGEYRSLLIKYTFKEIHNSSKGHFHKMGNSLDIELDQVEVDNFGAYSGNGGASSGTNCEFENVYMNYSCYGPGSAGTHFYRSQCQCGKIQPNGNILGCTPPRSETIIVEVCKDNNGNVSGNWTNNLNSNDTTAGGGGSSSVASIGSGISAFTYENPDGAVNLIASELSLNQSQIDFLNNSEGQLISDILNLMGSSQSEEFAKLAIEALINGSEVDFEDITIIDKTFKDSKTKCIHDKLNNGDNLYKTLLDKFDDSNTNILILKLGSTSNGDWGITKGDLDNTREFSITISNNIERSSNLAKIVTLTHELIHAYMLDTLEDWGYLTYDTNNNPSLNITCQNTNANVNLNNLSNEDRFVALICAMNQNGTLSTQWTHELFNSSSFDNQIYRQELENLILNNHDWDSESQTFKNNAKDLFGNNWKGEVAKAVSWIGLEKTDGYTDYLNSYNNNFQKFVYIQQIRNNISNLNSNCQ